MADYWVKWFYEIIDDPKMATLPDRLWRRFSELCLLTGRLFPDKSGRLPETKQIAWALRMKEDETEMDLTQLASVNLIRKTHEGWLVINFSKRQSPSSNAERKQAQRERERRQQYAGDSHENVTDRDNGVRQSRTEQNRTEPEQSAAAASPEFASLCAVYEKNIGMITPMVSDNLQADLDEYGLQNCMDAITEALKNNARKWAYVQSILKRWSVDGRDKPKPGTPPPPRTRKVLDVRGNVIAEVPL